MRITTIIATSPIPSIPEIGHISRTIESLSLVPELAESTIHIMFDAPRDEKPDPKYDEYKRNVEGFCRYRPNIQFSMIDRWGHLIGVMTHAVPLVTTEFMFVQQHDLPLIRPFDLGGVIECMRCDALVKIVRLNRRYNRPISWDRTPLFGDYPNPFVPLIKTGCWSDRSHITTPAYYRDIVLPDCRGKKTFMERVLNPKMARSSGEDLLSLHNRYGTFIYGEVGARPVIAHSDGRTDIMEIA